MSLCIGQLRSWQIELFFNCFIIILRTVGTSLASHIATAPLEGAQPTSRCSITLPLSPPPFTQLS